MCICNCRETLHICAECAQTTGVAKQGANVNIALSGIYVAGCLLGHLMTCIERYAGDLTEEVASLLASGFPLDGSPTYLA